MNRRQIVIFGLAALAASPSFASGYEEDIVASLRAQGYQQITVEITFLGRVRITAIKQSNLREIVINPRTGEILRDLWTAPDGRAIASPSEFDNRAAKEDSGKTRDGSDDDGSDHGPEGDGSRDGGSGNSGSGNSGSGNNGSGNSGSGDSSEDSKDESRDNSGHGSGDGRD